MQLKKKTHNRSNRQCIKLSVSTYIVELDFRLHSDFVTKVDHQLPNQQSLGNFKGT